MRLLLTAAAASLAIASAACTKQSDDNVATDTTINTDMSVDNVALTDNMMAPMAATDFASTIAASDMYEIAAGKLAQTMATNEACKKFGAMLVTDHTKSSAMLKIAAAGATPPVSLATTMPTELQAKLDALKAAKGAAFDTLFVEQQKDGHQKALDALKSYASSGDQASLKSFATDAAPVVQAHLDALNAMKM